MNEETRPDYVVCVRHMHEDLKDRTWCGRVAVGFCFHGVDHAAENGRQQGRLVACPDCVSMINEALRNGSE